MSKNWPVDLKRIALSMLVASFCLAVVLGPKAAMAADEKSAAPVEDQAKPALPALPALPAVPAPFVTKGTIDTITDDSAMIRFKVKANDGKDLKVAVYYGETNGGQAQKEWENNTGLVTYDKSRSRNDYTVTIDENLKPSTNYFYRILANTSDGGSTWSEPGEFKTAAAAAPWYLVVAVLLGIVGLFVVPFAISGFIAKRLKMPDHGWKIGLIIWSLAAAGVIIGFGWPPHLGIDLSGGVMLVYELEDTEEVQDEKKAADEDAAPEDAEKDKVQKVDINKLLGALALRINPGGTREITLRKYGPRQIEIIIPRASDEEVKRIEKKIVSAGTLEFRILANDTDHSDIISAARKTESNKVKDAAGNHIATWVPITKGREDEFVTYEGIATRAQNYAGEESLEILVAMDDYNVTGEYLAGTSTDYDRYMRPCVNFRFNAKGGHRFGGLTSDNVPEEVGGFERHLGIILNGYLYSAPTILARITTRGEITGTFTQEEAQDLVDVLNAGSLPARLKENPISRLQTGPTLGRDMIIRGAWSIGISLAVVLVFMILYYRFAGIVACFALLMTLLLVLAMMIAVKADFTLPGIAGLVLTVGIAVDANVLIFERMREELVKGAALRMAIRNGFGRATSAVVDANLTTLIIATVLFVFGQEQIKGFAVTLWLGVILSMFTALFCSRVIFDVAERQRWLTKLKMLRMFGQTSFDFIGKRYLGATVSIILIVVGLMCVGARGKGLLDIDFTGGVSVQVLFKNPEKIADVRGELADELPDLTVNDILLLETEKASIRFIVATSMQPDEEKTTKTKGEKPKSVIVKVEEIITAAFPGKLATNNMEIGQIVTQTAAQAQGDPAATDKPAEPATGGSRITLNFELEVNAETLEDYITAEYDAAGVSDGSFGLDRKDGFRPKDTEPYHDWIVETTLSTKKAKEVFESLQAKIASEPFFPSSSSIGGRVAQDMQLKAIYALLASLVFIVGYIWIRFQRVMFGLAAVAALVHDVLITLGVLAASAFVAPYLGFLLIDEFKIGLSVLAAFLTIIGYSLNDTIVVFDRIREVRGKSPDISGEMINLSINQTLSRTVLTSLTTLLVVVILYIGGGQGIHAFAFSLLVGVLVGTYSSIFVASPILYWMGHTVAKTKRTMN